MKRYLCALTVMALAGCRTDSNPPTEPTPFDNQPPSPTGASGSGGTSGASGPADGALPLDQCGMRPSWAGVEEEVDGLKVTITVPYQGENLILYVWLPEVNNGDKRGPFPFVDGIAAAVFYVTEYKAYRYQLAVEQDLDGDGLADRGCQDDRYHNEFETRRPNNPPPPPPGCQGENCDPPPSCDVEDLASEANEECSYGYVLNPVACSFACNPPPQCTIPGLDSILITDPRCVPPPECEFGDASLSNDLAWECPPPPPDEHGQCFYEVAGNEKEADCFDAGGAFGEHDGSDHCVFDFPGIARNGFNLAPGLSDPDCLRKQDED